MTLTAKQTVMVIKGLLNLQGTQEQAEHETITELDIQELIKLFEQHYGEVI